MTLLEPLTALLAGALAVPVLLAFYFLKLRRRTFRIGSTMLWQQAVTDLQVNTPFRWLRFNWLLVLQMLALLCLVIAAGRPALNMKGGARDQVVLLIDRSASMGATDAPRTDPATPRTRLDDAKARATEIVQNLRRAGATRFAVGTMAATAAMLTTFSRDDGSAAEAITALEPTDQPADLAAAMDLLKALAEERLAGKSADEEEVTPITVYLLSDGGFPPATTAGTPPPTIPRGIDLRFLQVGPPPGEVAKNIGIAAMTAKRDFDDPGTLRITLRLVSSTTTPTPVTVRLTLDDKVLGNTPITVTGDTTPPLTIPITERSGGLLTATILNTDALACDNRASLMLQTARPPNIMIVAPGNGTPPDADPFLMSFITALTDSTAAAARTTSRAGLERMLTTPNTFDGLDLIILDRVTTGRLPPIPTISFGVELPSLGFTLSPPKGDEQRFITWPRAHPVMRGINLDAVTLQSPRTLVIPSRTHATTLAEGIDGPLIALIEEGNPAPIRRIACSFPVSGPNGSTWGTDVSFLQFMSAALDYLTIRGQEKAGAFTTTATPATARILADAPDTVITEPNTAPRRITFPADPLAQPLSPNAPPREVPLGIPAHVGVLTVTNAALGGDRIAVNLFDDNESLCTTRATVAVNGGSGEGGEAIAAATGRGAPREVWDWFILTAVALLTLEWLLYAWRMRG